MTVTSLQINYEKKATKFFNKNATSTDEIKDLIIKAVRKLHGSNENLDLKMLKGKYFGYFRIRKGDLRIVFYFSKTNKQIVVTVANIDFRGSVYE